MTIHTSEDGFRFISMAYDPKCEDLARHFLGEHASEERVKELAQWLQDTAEDFLSFLE